MHLSEVKANITGISFTYVTECKYGMIHSYNKSNWSLEEPDKYLINFSFNESFL